MQPIRTAIKVSLWIICVFACSASSVNIRFVPMVVGGGSASFGYEVFGSAFDVAIEESRKMYPKVYRNFTLTRYYIPGSFKCEDAVEFQTIGLGNLLHNPEASTKTVDKEFRVILTPGCSFESIVLGDFARGWFSSDLLLTMKKLIKLFFMDRAIEEDVMMIASTASVDVLNNKRRFPTLLPWASTSYQNLVGALLQTMRLFKWNIFNFVCDISQANSGYVVALEVFCRIIQQVRGRTRDVTIISHQFDSSKPATIGPVLEQCRQYSAVTVIASMETQDYENILVQAARDGMANGDYVFLLLPLVDELDDWQVNQNSSSLLLQVLPFVMTFTFDHVNWAALGDMLKRMVNRSRDFYNLEIPSEDQHNLLFVAAFETISMLSQVLNENYDQLENLPAKVFISRFYNRTFQMASRNVSVSPTGARICNVFIQQMQWNNSTAMWKTEDLMEFDTVKSRLVKHKNFAAIRWLKGQFPPSVVPPCGFRHEKCNISQGGWMLPVIVSAAVAGLLGIVIVGLGVWYKLNHAKKAIAKIWWLLVSTELHEHQVHRFILVSLPSNIRKTA